MSSTEAMPGEGWPASDPEGREVRFTSPEPRPRPDEYTPVLEGKAIRLEPLREEHLDALCEIGLDPELTRLMPHPIRTRDDMAAYVAEALAARRSLKAIPFVTIFIPGQTLARVVGTTRFLNVDPANRRMEIGSTWIAKPWQRTRVNTEAKYLMLRHAFEVLGCIRIELKTDSLNLRSRQAILRIGAVQEGVFRNHLITSEGRIRHTVWFSITDRDWPRVKDRLEGMLGERSR